jgi:hypothetical protein
VSDWGVRAVVSSRLIIARPARFVNDSLKRNDPVIRDLFVGGQ